MERKARAVLLGAVAVLAGGALIWRVAGPRSTTASAVEAASVLRDVGPRLVSNQTSQPLALLGEHLPSGLTLVVTLPGGAELARVPAVRLDERHAYARLPAGLALPPEQPQVQVRLSLHAESALAPVGGTVALTLVNDAAFPDLTALVAAPDGKTLFALSGTNDTLYAIDPATGKVTARATGDGPSAIAPYVDAAGAAWIAVVHAFTAELWLLPVAGGDPVVLPAPANATALVIDAQRRTAYVAEHAANSVRALSLDPETRGTVRWVAAVAPGPRALAIAKDRLLVGSAQAGVLDALALDDGKELARFSPDSRTPIQGGHTAPFAKYAMGGKLPRALLYGARWDRLYVSSIGPNIGPNPDRMEVSMNGGVAVVAPSGRAPAFLAHLGFDQGVTEGLALDEPRGLLYAADGALGAVRILALDDAGMIRAPLPNPGEPATTPVAGWVEIPPPASFPRVRPAADFGIGRRATEAIHSGTRALVLSPDRRTLYALDRFTATLAVLDVAGADHGEAKVVAQLPILDPLGQRQRRLGQVLYGADLGRTAMTCEACHPDGHTEGVLFEKTHPMRIYRSPTIRAARETPPYFIPASTHSLAQTAHDVGGRNRFHNPDLTDAEIEALTLYSATLTLLPNPFVGPDGAPPETLRLPDSTESHPRRGLALFESKADCARCHPAPHFTTDQALSTRGQVFDVGTPLALPLRREWQELRGVGGFPAPSLLGTWDVFPLFTSGAGGFRLRAEDPAGTLEVAPGFTLRQALEAPPLRGKSHGNLAALTADERADLYGYVLSL